MRKNLYSAIERKRTFSPSSKERSSTPNKRLGHRQISLQHDILKQISQTIQPPSQAAQLLPQSQKSAAPTDFARLIKPTPFAKFSGKQIMTFHSAQNFAGIMSEPSSPLGSRESSAEKSFDTPNSGTFDKPALQGILKQREKSRFNKYNKKQSYKRQMSTPKVKIAEGLEFVEHL